MDKQCVLLWFILYLSLVFADNETFSGNTNFAQRRIFSCYLFSFALSPPLDQIFGFIRKKKEFYFDFLSFSVVLDRVSVKDDSRGLSHVVLLLCPIVMRVWLTQVVKNLIQLHDAQEEEIEEHNIIFTACQKANSIILLVVCDWGGE